MRAKAPDISGFPGINPNWVSGWRQRHAFLREYAEDPALALDELRSYADTGALRQKIEHLPAGLRSWERLLGSNLLNHAHQRLALVELAGIDSDRFDSRTASEAFAAAATSWWISASNLAGRLEGGRPAGDAFNLNEIPFAALGVVVGADPQSLVLARAHVEAYRRGYYASAAPYPVHQLLFRLMADIVGAADVPLAGQGRDEKSCIELFEARRTEDLGLLARCCEAVCDFHTHRINSRKDTVREFENGFWTRLPIEILLLFKLRQRLGLPLPESRHPLLQTALGRLPAEAGFVPDELVARVRARMAADGFDEALILRRLGFPAG